MAKSVLPQPAPPATRVGLPFGRPPLVMSSMPGIPVGDFGRRFTRCFFGCVGDTIFSSKADFNQFLWR